MKQVVSGQWLVVRRIKKVLRYKIQDLRFKSFLATCNLQLITFILLFTVHCSLSTVLTGCAAKEKEIKPASGYFDLLNQMTRSKKVIDRLESKLFVYATYKSWPLRAAYIEEYASRYQMDDYQRQKLEEQEKDLDERFNEFFIAVYTPEEKWNDFEHYDSIWKMYMEDEKGNRISPYRINKVDVNSPLIREFYPYLDLWSSGYIIRFPKYMVGGEEPFPGKDAAYFRLIITGVVGSAELEWQLK